MIKSLTPFVVLVAACGSTSPAPATAHVQPPASETAEAADFRMICDEAIRVSRQPGTPEQRQQSLAAAVIEKLHTGGARKVVKFAGQEPANKKLAALKAGANELSVTWDCPAIATIYGPQDASVE